MSVTVWTGCSCGMQAKLSEPMMQPISKVPGGTSSISMLLELSRMRHAKPDAIMALRNVASVTTAGSGNASISVAPVGTMTEAYVNASAAVAVPPALMTVIATAPDDLAGGVTAYTKVDDSTCSFVQATPPTSTASVPPRLVPLIVICVPPKIDPCSGVTEVTVPGQDPQLFGEAWPFPSRRF